MSNIPARIGSYPIEREIGRGGMGVVYLGRDEELGRDVAIKVLPENLADDLERLARFEREAKTLASLSHPNIAAIYGLELAGESKALVLEYVDGGSLSDRLENGPLTVEEAVAIGLELAMALEAAHEAGVVHRDLKPDNVLFTAEGQLKVLDFGLAMELASGSTLDLTHMPTAAAGETQPGTVLGTIPYMSPEQARGRPLDKRSDIFSFGSVLFECLTGQSAFPGETASDVLVAVLDREPDWDALPERTPRRVRELLRRCVAKEPARRLRDIGDARLELEEAVARREWSTEDWQKKGTDKPGRNRLASWVGLAIALGVGLLFGSLVSDAGRDASLRESAEGMRISLALEPDHRICLDDEIAITPDGKSIVYCALAPDPDQGEIRRLFRRDLESFEVRALPGTEMAEHAVLSPDGRWLAWGARQAGAGDYEIRKALLDGGPVVKLWSREATQGFGRLTLTWLDQDSLLIVTGSSNQELSRLPAAGGEARLISKADQSQIGGWILDVQSVPGGRHALLAVAEVGAQGYRVGIWSVDLATGDRALVMEDADSPRLLGDRLLFARDGAILAASFDRATATVTQSAIPVLSGLWQRARWSDGDFWVAPSGTLVFLPGGRGSGRHRLMAVDRAGRSEALIDLELDYQEDAHPSPDGRLLAVVVSDAQDAYRVAVIDLDRGSSRLVEVPGHGCEGAFWSPDSQELAVECYNSEAGLSIYRFPSRGGEPELVASFPVSDENILIGGWLPDGAGILVVRSTPATSSIAALSFDTGKLSDLAGLEEGVLDARPSPDGRWLAIVASERGRAEVYVRPMSGSGERWKISRMGGRQPAWSADGRELYYLDPATVVQAVRVDSETGFRVSQPEPLFDLESVDTFDNIDGDRFAPLADGRFVIIERSVQERSPNHIDLVLGFGSELEHLVSR